MKDRYAAKMTAPTVELERCPACRCQKPTVEDCRICPLLSPEEIAGVALAIVRHGNADVVPKEKP